MSLSSHIVILGVLFLVIACKYSEYPLYSFKACDSSKGNNLLSVRLSTDEDKIAIVSYRLWPHQNQDIFNFGGDKICKFELLPNHEFIGWPSKTSGIYYDRVNYSLWKANSPCTSPEHFADLPGILYLDDKFPTTFTSSESFMAFNFYDNN